MKRNAQEVLAALWRSPLLLPILAGAVARLAMLPFAHLDHPNLWEYGWIADFLYHGHGYVYHWSYRNIDFLVPSAWMLPGEVMIHYAGLLLFGDTIRAYGFIFLEHVAIGTLFIVAMHGILKQLFLQTRIVRLGTWMAALYPSFIYAASSFGITSAVLTIDAFFLWSLLELSRRLREGGNVYSAAVAVGLSAGALTQFRSESYAIVFLSFLLIAWQRWKKPRLVSALAIAMGVAGLVAAPWIVRNAIQFHRFVPATTTGGFDFWRGHDPYSTGSSWSNGGTPNWTSEAMMEEFEPRAVPDSNVEFQSNRYHLAKALEWIRTHPGTEAEQTVKKLAMFWGVDWYNPEARTIPYLLLYLLTVLMAVVGIIRIRREQWYRDPLHREALRLMVLWYGFYTLLVMVFFSLPRLQVLMIAFCFPVIVYGTDWILQRARVFLNGSKTISENETARK